jgi:hypothetical protein
MSKRERVIPCTFEAGEHILSRQRYVTFDGDGHVIPADEAHAFGIIREGHSASAFLKGHAVPVGLFIDEMAEAVGWQAANVYESWGDDT